MSRKGISFMAILIALALVSAACGSDSNNETASGDEQQSQSAETESDAEEAETEETDTDEGAGEGAEATYVATEFAFEGPDVLPAGETTLTMDNQGKQMHELALGELLQEKTMDDVHALLQKGLPKKPPEWFRDVSGTGAKPGEVASTDVNLTPGSYVMICFVPDKASKQPHVMLGMMKEVTVE